MQQHAWVDDSDLSLYRRRIKTICSPLEGIGLARLYTRTNLDFEIKLHAFPLALAFTNLN